MITSPKKAEITGCQIKLLILAVVAVMVSSCATHKEIIQWNVELQESNMPLTDRCDPNKKLTSIKSAEKPKLIPATEDREARVQVEGIPCRPKEDPQIYEVPVSRVKRVTYVSDPLSPPQEFSANDLMPLEGCCRTRDGLWFFDKFEIKAAVGYRGDKDSIFYYPDKMYRSKLINFDRGGSSLVFGLELDGLWNLKFIDNSGRLQGGILLGLWPVDGSLFVPAGLNLRYTLNQYPSKYSDNCNSWYFYGNAGLPLDFQTKAPIFHRLWKFQRSFLGAGVGYDIAVSCDWDLSIDLGYRYMNLPLPEITCCPQIPEDDKFPYRSSNVLLLRFGVTF